MLQMWVQSKATERGGDAGGEERLTPRAGHHRRPWPGPGAMRKYQEHLPSVNGKVERTRTRAISYLGTAATVSFTGQTNKPLSPLNINSQKQCALRTHGGDLPPLMHADSGGGGFTGHNSEMREPLDPRAGKLLPDSRGQDLGFSRSQLSREGGGSWGMTTAHGLRISF